MVKEDEVISRYTHPCPACGAAIRPSDVHLYGDSFVCPSCGEWLKYDGKRTLPIMGISVALAILLTSYMGYKNWAFFASMTVAAVLLFFAGMFVGGIVAPRGFKREQGKPFDKTPSLFVSDTDKKTGP